MATVTGNNAGRSPANVQENKGLYWRLWIASMTVIVVMMTFAPKIWGHTLFDNFGITFNGGPTMILVVLVYLALSLREVSADEVSAAFSYGKALVSLPSGLHFVPFGLMQVRKGPRTVQEFQCPGEPEKVQKTDDAIPLESGMVRPIRVVTGGSKGNKNEILDTRMTLTVSFFVQWAITDILDYASNYGSSVRIEEQVRDIGEAILAEVATAHTPASFIADLPGINKHLTTNVGKRFKNSGVRIISTRLISPDISHEVSTALADIPKARVLAAQMAIKAEGDKTRLVKEGAGKASAELALLKARAEGQKKMRDDLEVDGKDILASEAVRGILAQTDVLVMGGDGMKDAMGLVKAAQSAFNSNKGATP